LNILHNHFIETWLAINKNDIQVILDYIEDSS